MQNTALPETISALAMRAKSDPVAFGRLYNHYVQPVYHYLFSRVGTVQEAEDLTSQTFMAAYEALPKYRESGQFAAWLFRIARSKMNDYFRRSQGKPELELDVEGTLIEREDTLGQVIQDQELSRLRRLIQGLSPEDQELIRLRFVAELSFAEMAELLGRREDTVKKTLYRLLARLKDQME